MALQLCLCSLYDEIKEGGKEASDGLPEHEMVKLILDTLLGFGYLNDHNVHHGDIKPHNILMDMNGNYIISDFGLSKVIVNGEKLSEIGRSADYCHPILYELMNWKALYPGTKRPNDRTWPATTDIWSLAVTWFQSVNASKPFAAKTPIKMFEVCQH